MNPGQRPLIAIVGELLAEKTRKVALATRYSAAVERAGGLPLILPTLEANDPAAAVGSVDGVLFAGGDDFDTQRLGLGPTHPRANPVPTEKQDFDIALARVILEQRLPVLGICYGMQLLALAEDGDLHQHLPDDLPGSQDHTGGREHPVRLERGTKLFSLLGVADVTVVSRHHQALSRVGERWRVSARDEEGLIEAVEHEDHPFALGVQWHPELPPQDEPDGELQGRLFRGLVQAADEHRAERFFAQGAQLT